MAKTFRILTVLGSPHDAKSNTRALVEDFVEELEAAGLPLTHQVISLAKLRVQPCRGCWACASERPCPLSRDDDIETIKAALLDCDMLILASPVYTNQVTAQMKALFDRLFTWCHVFPLLGKPALSACTTGNDGFRETGEFLEKMLATWGTNSFGTIHSGGAFTPGFFPRRAQARKKHRRLARKVARTLLEGRALPRNRVQHRMFRAMKRKFSAQYAIHCLLFGRPDGQPAPSWLMTRLIQRRLRQIGSPAMLERVAKICNFELHWWMARGWLAARSFRQLAGMPVPAGWDGRRRLLGASGGSVHKPQLRDGPAHRLSSDGTAASVHVVGVEEQLGSGQPCSLDRGAGGRDLGPGR